MFGRSVHTTGHRGSDCDEAMRASYEVGKEEVVEECRRRRPKKEEEQEGEEKKQEGTKSRNIVYHLPFQRKPPFALRTSVLRYRKYQA